jgi:ABC-type methionine transport system permease subunit
MIGFEFKAVLLINIIYKLTTFVSATLVGSHSAFLPLVVMVFEVTTFSISLLEEKS